MPKLSLLILLLAGSIAVHAQLPYRIDSTYGTNGLTFFELYDVPPYTGVWFHKAMFSAIQKDDKVVALGVNSANGAAELLRFKTNGTLDSTFNSTGFVNIPAPGIGLANTYSYSEEGLAVDTAGYIICAHKILHPSSQYSSIQCYKPNGTLNTSFGSGGTDTLRDLYPQCLSISKGTNKIFVSGYYQPASTMSLFMIFSLNSNGTRNTAFGANGVVRCFDTRLMTNNNNAASAVKALDDGRVYIAGSSQRMIPAGTPDSFFVARLKANGTADSTFGVNGFVFHETQPTLVGFSVPCNIHTDATGNVYVVASVANSSGDTNHITVLKVDATGAAVSGFGSGGYLTVGTTFAPFFSSAYSSRRTVSILQEDGKLIIAGTSDTSITSSYKICRLNTDGSLDGTFDPGGIFNVWDGRRDRCTGLQQQTDGKLLMTGYFTAIYPGLDTAGTMVVRLTNKPFSTATVRPVEGEQYTVTFAAYPNPSSDGNYHITCTGLQADYAAVLRLYDVTGRLLATTTLRFPAGGQAISYQLPTGCTPGMYQLKLSLEGGSEAILKLVSY